MIAAIYIAGVVVSAVLWFFIAKLLVDFYHQIDAFLVASILFGLVVTSIALGTFSLELFIEINSKLAHHIACIEFICV